MVSVKIVLESKEDVKAVNWLHIKERVMTDAAEKIVEALKQASSEIAELKDGEVRNFDIKIGTITISKEA